MKMDKIIIGVENRANKVLVLMLLFAWTTTVVQPVEARQVGDRSYVAVTSSYFELKDDFNHGFVFRGPDVLLEYGRERTSEKRQSEFLVQIGGGGKAAAGSWGFRWAITPAQYARLFRIPTRSAFPLFVGPTISLDYGVQNYPDMHAGPINWMTSVSAGLRARGHIVSRQQLIRFRISYSPVGLVSRPSVHRDQHVFSVRVGDIISDLHKDFQFAGPASFRRTDLLVEYFLGRQQSKHAIGYHVISNHVSQGPNFSELSHSIRYTFYFSEVSW